MAPLWKVFVDVKDSVEFPPATDFSKVFNVVKGTRIVVLCVSVVFVSNVVFSKMVPCLQRSGCFISNGISEVQKCSLMTDQPFVKKSLAVPHVS